MCETLNVVSQFHQTGENDSTQVVVLVLVALFQYGQPLLFILGHQAQFWGRHHPRDSRRLHEFIGKPLLLLAMREHVPCLSIDRLFPIGNLEHMF